MQEVVSLMDVQGNVLGEDEKITYSVIFPITLHSQGITVDLVIAR